MLAARWRPWQDRNPERSRGNALVLIWLASQPTALIVVVAVASVYGLALAVLLPVRLVGSRGMAADFKALSPVTLTPLAAVFAFLIFPLASNVWGNLQRAQSYLSQEAGALREVALFARTLPEDVRTNVTEAVRRHITNVVGEEWSAMERGQASIAALPDVLLGAMTSLLAHDFADSGQQLARGEVIDAIQEALAARRQRILLSQASTSPIQWAVVVLIDILVLTTIAMVHIDHRRTQVVGMLIWSSAVAACFVAVLVFDRPYGGGGISLAPHALQDVMP
jgi:hypothetical protein